MKALDDVLRGIREAGFSIYEPLDSRPDLLLSASQLEAALNSLRGLSLDYPIRTRSKVFKTAVCDALGYPVPHSFRKTRPRFPGQNFDTYLQKSNNLQIWNEEIVPGRRYVVCRVDGKSRLQKVKVISGEALERLDTTGTLTRKYQAKRRAGSEGSRLVSSADTPTLRHLLALGAVRERPPRSAASVPLPGDVLPIDRVYDALGNLVGRRFFNPGRDQERLRGGALQQEVCKALGLSDWAECGQFPDVLAQLIEVKLQTAPTVDLGLVLPTHDSRLASYPDVRHCDVRYAVFFGEIKADSIQITALVVSTGAEFFDEFRQFGGLVSNAKIQLPLPQGFFD